VQAGAKQPHPTSPPVPVVLSYVLIWIRLQALGAADYIAISKEFHTVIVSGIPKMEDRHREQAKRFITLVDELYNHKVKMICSAAAEPRQLFAGGVEKREWFDDATGKSVGTIWQGEEERFMFNRTVSRLIEMQSDDYLQSPHKKDA
jgi:predicted ATPase